MHTVEPVNPAILDRYRRPGRRGGRPSTSRGACLPGLLVLALLAAALLPAVPAGAQESCRLPSDEQVERGNRTQTEEFYQTTPCSFQISTLTRQLRA